MSQIPSTQLIQWLEQVGDSDAETLVDPTPTVLAVDDKDSSWLSFLHGYGKLVGQFGEPDFPLNCGKDWRSTLGFATDLAVVWDFDYYQISLRVRATDGAILFAKHYG